MIISAEFQGLNSDFRTKHAILKNCNFILYIYLRELELAFTLMLRWDSCMDTYNLWATSLGVLKELVCTKYHLITLEGKRDHQK